IGYSNYLARASRPNKMSRLVAHNFRAGDPKLMRTRPRLSCNYRAASPVEKQRLFFGRDYEALAGPLIFISPWQGNEPLSLYSLAILIAYALGCLKLEEQAARAGASNDSISGAAERFFACAYSYNFIHFLIEHISFLSDDNSLSLAKVPPAIRYTYRNLFDQAISNYQAMAPAEQESFLVRKGRPDQGGEIFLGCPFSVDLASTKELLFISERS
ncbi:MAG TPA: hypothetical protein VMT55_00490, partial [Candidatus Sulfotelmatobacter sp.]|nr:hypothetical protein [Candidatus Sulfotelmatobacter sp.]